jgi:hypothetical protein
MRQARCFCLANATGLDSRASNERVDEMLSLSFNLKLEGLRMQLMYLQVYLYPYFGFSLCHFVVP